MNPGDAKARFIAASKLISADTASIEKFEAVRDLISGLNPQVDNLLKKCSEAISKIEKLQKNDVIEFSAESLPENTEEQKKRKKVILLFIRYWRDLQSEMERVRAEFEDRGEKSSQEQVAGAGKIAAFAKGPFGIITLAAVIIAVILIFIGGKNQNQVQTQASISTSNVSPSPTPSSTPSSSPSNKKVKVITYNKKKIALTELRVATGPDCMVERVEVAHYHALERIAVRALDGTTIQDPGSCGFGKVEEVKVEEVDAI